MPFRFSGETKEKVTLSCHLEMTDVQQMYQEKTKNFSALGTSERVASLDFSKNLLPLILHFFNDDGELGDKGSNGPNRRALQLSLTSL